MCSSVSVGVFWKAIIMFAKVLVGCLFIVFLNFLYIYLKFQAFVVAVSVVMINAGYLGGYEGHGGFGGGGHGVSSQTVIRQHIPSYGSHGIDEHSHNVHVSIIFCI